MSSQLCLNNNLCATVVLLFAMISSSNRSLSTAHRLYTDICDLGIREDNTNYINCTGRSLQSVPDFSKFNSVCDELILTNNRITHVHSNSFEGIQSLKKIHLGGNPISQLDPNTFAHVQQSLEHLVIDFDNLVPVTRLPPVSTLKLLTITRAKIPFWTKKTPLLTASNRLKNLTITNCSFKGFEEHVLKTFKSIEHLDLSLNTTFVLNEAREVRINVPKLKRFSEPLQSLRVLNLSQNSIEEIEDMDNWPNLEILDASQNLIKTLPYTLPNGACDTTSISKLISLILRNNYIHRIAPCPLSPFKRLEQLDLSQNMITEITNNPLKNCCSKLGEIRLEMQKYGGLRKVDQLLLSNQDSVSLVNLSRNSIRFLALTKGSTISSIDISRNQLESLPSFLITGKINSINMAHNSITHLNPMPLRAMMNRLKSGGKIDLFDNPIHCSCDLLLFLNNSKFVQTQLDCVTCQTPEGIRGVKLVEMKRLLYSHCLKQNKPIPHFTKLQATRDESESVLISWEIANPDQVIEFFIWIQVPGERTLQYRVSDQHRQYKIFNVAHDNCKACILTLLVDNRLSNKLCTKIHYKSSYQRLGKIIANQPIFPLMLISLPLIISLIFLSKIRQRLKRSSSSACSQITDFHPHDHQKPRVLLTSYSINGTAKSIALIENETEMTSNTCCRKHHPPATLRLLCSPPPVLNMVYVHNEDIGDVNESVSFGSDIQSATECEDILHIYQELSTCRCDHCSHPNQR